MWGWYGAMWQIKLGFSFEKKSGQQYSELIESVEWLDKNHSNEILKQTQY